MKASTRKLQVNNLVPHLILQGYRAINFRRRNPARQAPELEQPLGSYDVTAAAASLRNTQNGGVVERSLQIDGMLALMLLCDRRALFIEDLFDGYEPKED